MMRLLICMVVATLAAPLARSQAPDTTKVPIERTPEIEAAEAVALGASLAAYGRRAGSAEALVAAAALLIENPAPVGRLDGEVEGDADVPSLNPADLLTEAEALAAPDAALRAHIAELRGRAPAEFPPVRGAERGPIRYRAAAAPEALREHALTFRGREPAVFRLIGDGSSDLDYYLYDVNGELVASSDDARDEATLTWYVPYRQRLVLRVRNRGDRRNAYHIITN